MNCNHRSFQQNTGLEFAIINCPWCKITVPKPPLMNKFGRGEGVDEVLTVLHEVLGILGDVFAVLDVLDEVLAGLDEVLTMVDEEPTLQYQVSPKFSAAQQEAWG